MKSALFSPIRTRDQSTQLRIRLLNTILWSTVGATVAYTAILALLFSPLQSSSVIVSLIPLPLAAALLVALRRGYVRLAALLFAAAVWLLMFVGAVMAGGVRSPAYGGFVLSILIAGWLLGKRAALLIALLSALAGPLLVAGFAHGWLSQSVTNTETSVWMSQLLIFFIVAAILYVASDNQEKMIEQVQSSAALALETKDRLLAEFEARRAAEEELKFQADVLVQVHDAIIVTDQKRRVLFWNEAAKQLFDFSNEQVFHRPIEEIFDFDRERRSTNGREETLRRRGIWHGEDRLMVRGSGRKIDVDISVQLVNHHEALRPHYIISARDISDRKKAEAELRERDRQLSKLADQMTQLHEIDRAIFSAQSLEAAVDSALLRLFDLCDCAYNSIFLVDADRQTAALLARYPREAHAPAQEFVPLASVDYLPELSTGKILLDNLLEQKDRCPAPEPALEQVDVEAIARVPLKARDELLGILTLAFKRAEAMDEISVDLVASIASSLSVAMMNMRLYQQVEMHRDELQEKIAASTAVLRRQYHYQAALANIELAINEPSELKSVLKQIVTVTTEALPADVGVSIVLWDPERERYVVSASTVRAQGDDLMTARVRKRGGATRWILDHAQPLIVSDVADDPFGASTLIREYNVGSYIGVPLTVEGRAIGVLYALMSQPRDIEDEEVRFLSTVSGRAALAITKVRLFEQAQIIAAEEERRRIARDLHDVVSQSLFSASVIAESLPLLLDRDPELVRSGLEDLHALTLGAAAEMRTLLFELRPTDVVETDLDELVGQLSDAFTRTTHVPASLSVDAGIRLPPGIQVGVYRIVQEALNNITKHAHAKHVWIDLTYQNGVLRLQIRDDGRGFDTGQLPVSHMGVRIMRERAAEIGATIEVRSAIGAGTSILLTRLFGRSDSDERNAFNSNLARG